MDDEKIIALLREKYRDLTPIFDERSRRLWAATEAKAIGHGGQTLVAQATGLSRRTSYYLYRIRRTQATQKFKFWFSKTYSSSRWRMKTVS